MEGGVDLRHDSKRQRGTTHPASAVHVDVDVDIGIGTGVGVVPTAKRAAEGSKAATAIVTAVDVGGYTTGKQSEAAVDCEGYTSTAAASLSGQLPQTTTSKTPSKDGGGREEAPLDSAGDIRRL
jgi:hypothetical protein